MTTEQAIQLLAWFRRNRDIKCGTWDEDFIPAATYFSYEKNSVVVEFDIAQTFGDLKFRRVCARAEKDTDISFRQLAHELGDANAEIAAYESKRAERRAANERAANERAANERAANEQRRQRWLAEHPIK